MFPAYVADYLDDNDYAALQACLSEQPDAGDLRQERAGIDPGACAGTTARGTGTWAS